MARNNGHFIGSVIGLVVITNGNFRRREVNGTFKLIEGFKVGKKSTYVTVEATQELYDMLPPSHRKNDFVAGMKLRINVAQNDVQEFVTQEVDFTNVEIKGQNDNYTTTGKLVPISKFAKEFGYTKDQFRGYVRRNKPGFEYDLAKNEEGVNCVVV